MTVESQSNETVQLLANLVKKHLLNKVLINFFTYFLPVKTAKDNKIVFFGLQHK